MGDLFVGYLVEDFGPSKSRTPTFLLRLKQGQEFVEFLVFSSVYPSVQRRSTVHGRCSHTSFLIT